MTTGYIWYVFGSHGGYRSGNTDTLERVEGLEPYESGDEAMKKDRVKDKDAEVV
jgi:hypothetical protein